VAELIVAFDQPTGREALTVADRLPGLAWAKIGPILYVREGPALVREFASRGVRVFLDLKWHDIPSTVAGAVAAARDLGVHLATVHCLGGGPMLEAAARAAGDLPLVGVTVLTSHDGPGLTSLLGRAVTDVTGEVGRLARMAAIAGLRGIVAAGHDIAVARRAFGNDPWIVVPGVRRPTDSAGDQARTIAPGAAVGAGATHLVVGRSITQAPDPAAVYQEIRACL
jgi:orotidine-5'-phosphate decarboxylase